MIQDRDPGDETSHVPFLFGVMPFREISLDEAHQLFPVPRLVATYDLSRDERASLLPATVDDREADYGPARSARTMTVEEQAEHDFYEGRYWPDLPALHARRGWPVYGVAKIGAAVVSSGVNHVQPTLERVKQDQAQRQEDAVAFTPRRASRIASLSAPQAVLNAFGSEVLQFYLDNPPLASDLEFVDEVDLDEALDLEDEGVWPEIVAWGRRSWRASDQSGWDARSAMEQGLSDLVVYIGPWGAFAA